MVKRVITWTAGFVGAFVGVWLISSLVSQVTSLGFPGRPVQFADFKLYSIDCSTRGEVTDLQAWTAAVCRQAASDARQSCEREEVVEVGACRELGAIIRNAVRRTQIVYWSVGLPTMLIGPLVRIRGAGFGMFLAGTQVFLGVASGMRNLPLRLWIAAVVWGGNLILLVFQRITVRRRAKAPS